jgi:hypothetical protein
MGTRIELLVNVAIKLIDAIVYHLDPGRLNMIEVHRRLHEEDRRLMTNLQEVP